VTRISPADGVEHDDARPEGERPRRVGIISLGCAKNLVDTEVMLGHLDRAGCEFVQDPQDADVIVINTCGFIEPAREESVNTILEAARLKQTGRLQRLVVAGCMVQRYRDELAESLPEVDAFIGLDELDQVVPGTGLVRGTPFPGPAQPKSALTVLPTSRTVEAPGAPAVAAWGASSFLYDHETPRRIATPAWTAYLKIAEGCDHTCAFCAIPGFRGSFRSREAESIVREAETLARGGVRELNLIAQDTSHYGRDRGESNGLAELLKRLDRIDSIRWIRVHYLYPNTVTPELIDTMAGCARVVPYVDIPLQHAHRETLKRMRRGGSAESHMKLLDKFRETLPEATLRTTFIVGFPGESEEEFARLMAFVDEARFDHVGAFTYSHEESTPAMELHDDVPSEVKEIRRDRLMDAQQAIVLERHATLIGSRHEVLVEGSHPETEHLLVGRMASQAPEVDGQVIINDGVASPGSFVTVELTETAGYDLVGRVV
jgi:ribosomal protein S12 methylthiotransferase